MSDNNRHAEFKKTVQELQVQEKLKQEEQARLDARIEAIEERQERYAESYAKSAVRAKKKWKKVEEKGKELKADSLRGYDSLVSIWCSMITTDLALADAIKASNPIGCLVGYPFRYISDATRDVLKYAWDEVGARIKLTAGYRPEVVLPMLSYYVKLDADNTLNVISLKNSLQKPELAFTPEQLDDMDADFEEAVIDWIESMDGRKYSLEVVAGTRDKFKIIKTEGAVKTELDGAAFEALRDDPVNGFTEFLQRRFDLTFKYTESEIAKPAESIESPRPRGP